MPVWSWFFIAAAVLIAITLILLAVLSMTRRRRRKGAVSLAGLDIVALSPQAHARYVEHWGTLQSAFVDDPAAAVSDADRLVTALMRERGYPVDDFELRAAELAVDHPDVVDHYRAGHALHDAQERGDIGTEARREAFVHYRTLFEKLLEVDEHMAAPAKEARG